MSTPAPEKDEWDAGREAARAYSLTDKVRAVIFSSDVAVLRKAERGPSRRQHDKLLTQMQELIRSGKEQEARDAIDNTS